MTTIDIRGIVPGPYLVLGATFTLNGQSLGTVGLTGDVTSLPNSFLTTIGAGVVTYAKIQTVGASKLLGNPLVSGASASEISLGATLTFSGSALQTVAHTGDITSAANSFATTIAANAVTNGKFRQSAGLSVVGNTGTAAANVADITGTASQFLGVNAGGTTLAFQTLSGDATLSGGVLTVSAAAITYSKMQNVSASRLLGNPTGAGAAPSEISLGATLTFSGSALQTVAHTGDVTTAANSFATTISANAVTNAKLATASDATIKSNISGASASPSDNTLTAVIDHCIGSTQGAIMTRGAANWNTLLGPGAAGQVPTSQGAGANLVMAYPGKVLLNTLVAANSATLVDTTSLTSNFDLYEIEFENIVSVTNLTSFGMRVSENGGTTYLSASYVSSAAGFIGSGTGVDSATDRILLSGAGATLDGISNSANYGMCGRVRIHVPSGTTSRKIVEGEAAYYVPSIPHTDIVRLHGLYDGDNGAINAIQFLCGSGNISTGKIRIYGVRTS